MQTLLCQLQLLLRGEPAGDLSHLYSMQEEVMENTKLAMKRGMKRLNRAFKQSKSNHFLYLALFAFGMFFVVLFWTKAARFLRIFG